MAGSLSEETRGEAKAEVRVLEARERGCGLACSAAILRSALRMAASVNSSGADESSRSCARKRLECAHTRTRG